MAQKPFWSEDIDGQEVKQETVWNVLDLVQVAASEYYRYLMHPIDKANHPPTDRTEDILADVRRGILAKARWAGGFAGRGWYLRSQEGRRI
jgi:hypothetical protein